MDLSDNRQPNLYASSTIPFFLAIVAVTLRLWSRWTKRAGFWLDDWLILFALVRADPPFCGLQLTEVYFFSRPLLSAWLLPCYGVRQSILDPAPSVKLT